MSWFLVEKFSVKTEASFESQPTHFYQLEGNSKVCMSHISVPESV